MAKFLFQNLDAEIRALMLQEIQNDVQAEKLFLSDRLNEQGKASYQNYLIQCVESSDEEVLEQLLTLNEHFKPTYLRLDKPAKMPSNASNLLCSSEFNRYYIRAVCILGLNNSIEDVEIYRARESSRTRPESEAKIGTFLSCKDLLDDLRNSIGTEPKLFPEINSGLCVKINL